MKGLLGKGKKDNSKAKCYSFRSKTVCAFLLILSSLLSATRTGRSTVHYFFSQTELKLSAAPITKSAQSKGLPGIY